MEKISVIMGVYNGEKYLREAIESILNQTYKDFEFIICDDGSTDNSIKIVEDYGRKDKRIIFIQNEENMGLAATLNICIGRAKGEYIARMDCDDVSLKDRFAIQTYFLDKNPSVDIVGGCSNLFDENGLYGVRRMHNNWSKINVFKSNFFIHPTVMLRKHVILSVDGYTVAPYTYRAEDYDLWCKLCEKGYRGHNLDEILLNYREDKNAYKRRKFKYRLDMLEMKKKWFKKLNIPSKYGLYVYQPIIAGLIPGPIMKRYHEWQFRK